MRRARAFARTKTSRRRRTSPRSFIGSLEERAQKGLLAEAEQARRAVALADFAQAWNNLGVVPEEALRLDESRLCLERAPRTSRPRATSATSSSASEIRRKPDDRFWRFLPIASLPAFWPIASVAERVSMAWTPPERTSRNAGKASLLLRGCLADNPAQPY